MGRDDWAHASLSGAICSHSNAATGHQLLVAVSLQVHSGGHLPLISRSHSYCSSLSLCLEWYNRSITPRVHSAVTKRIVCMLHCRPSATEDISLLNRCLEWHKWVLNELLHSRQWFNTLIQRSVVQPTLYSFCHAWVHPWGHRPVIPLQTQRQR